tara:strand:- start:1166 stop:3787 length:2622 start_codon:yes stop_codon:yes gene_type:complete
MVFQVRQDQQAAIDREARRQREAAAATAANQLTLEAESNINSQQLLLENLRAVVANSSYLYETAEYKADTAKHILPYYGPPDDVVTKMINPPNSSEFLQATPAQLSMLEPLLRFFIVDNEGNQQEVYFSDHTLASRTLKLASLRRGNSVDELLSPRDQRGSDVGIKSFTWNYHNKHEGDRIITAKLELYFGTLTELVNLNYLQFLFTDGRQSTYAPPIKQNAKDKSLKGRLNRLHEQLDVLSPLMVPGNSTVSADLASKGNFRQLKVAVGWSVPKGNKEALRRMFVKDGDQALKSGSAQYKTSNQRYLNFISGIESTQKIILLSMKAYDVDFSQEGPTTLTIEYVGSTDQYLSGPSSDVLGKNNFSTGTLNKKQVGVLLGELNLNNVYPDGYIAAKLREQKANNTEETEKIYVRLDRLQAESNVIETRQKISEIRGEIYGAAGESKNQKAYEAYAKSVETLYFAAQRTIRSQRYAQFVSELLGQGTVKESRIFTATAKYNLATNATDFSFAEANTVNQKEALARLVPLTKLKVKQAKEADIELLTKQNTFKRRPLGGISAAHTGTQILFVRFGDIVRTGMRLAGLRDDITLVLGSFTPGRLGAKGYNLGGDEDVCIYDIPIALDYFSQYFFNNVIQHERSEYPFRQFFDDLVSTLGRLLNNISNYEMRVSFGYTLYMTTDPLEKPNTPAEKKAAGGGDTTHTVLTPKIVAGLSNSHKNFELFMSTKPIHNYYILFAKQAGTGKSGNRLQDEANGIFHYTLGADRGLAKNFNFSKQDVPQFQAMNIEQANLASAGTALSQALILPQDVSIEMVGNSLHRNGDMIYVDSRAALGTFANQVLALGGYYRVVRSNHSITSAGYNTTVDAKFQERTNG